MGQQINTVFHNGQINDMDEFVGENKLYSTHQALIRDAVRDKITELKSSS